MRRVFHWLTQRNKFYVSTLFDYDFPANMSFYEAVGEMHLLAYCYHWDRNTIFNMGRQERKLWYKMVLAQKNAEKNS